MKNFHFRLDRVLHWRTSRAQLERQKLQQLLQEEKAVEAALAVLASDRSKGRTLLDETLIPGSDLNALSAYHLHLRKQELLLLARRNECRQRIEEQRAIFTRARRDQRLLEMLKNKQLEEWKAALNREVESLAAEAYLATWNTN